MRISGASPGKTIANFARPRNRAPRDKHGVAGAALRLLQRTRLTPSGQRSGHLLSLMPTTATILAWLERLARAHHMLDQRALSAGAVQHLRQREFHRVPLPAARITITKSEVAIPSLSRVHPRLTMNGNRQRFEWDNSPARLPIND